MCRVEMRKTKFRERKTIHKWKKEERKWINICFIGRIISFLFLYRAWLFCVIFSTPTPTKQQRLRKLSGLLKSTNLKMLDSEFKRRYKKLRCKFQECGACFDLIYFSAKQTECRISLGKKWMVKIHKWVKKQTPEPWPCTVQPLQGLFTKCQSMQDSEPWLGK